MLFRSIGAATDKPVAETPEINRDLDSGVETHSDSAASAAGTLNKTVARAAIK